MGRSRGCGCPSAPRPVLTSPLAQSPAPRTLPLPCEGGASLGASCERGFLAPAPSWPGTPGPLPSPPAPRSGSSRASLASEHPRRQTAGSSVPAVACRSRPPQAMARLVTCSGTSLPGFSFTTESGSRSGQEGRSRPSRPGSFSKP